MSIPVVLYEHMTREMSVWPVPEDISPYHYQELIYQFGMRDGMIYETSPDIRIKITRAINKIIEIKKEQELTGNAR